MTLRIAIIDDEPRAHNVLENYINRIPDATVLAKFTNALDACEYMKSNVVDLVLLDITMPQIDGFTLLKMLEKPPLIIFTTAHSEYALESYEYSAVDYLKKPIPFERFLKAINKAQAALELNQSKVVPELIQLKIDGELKTFSFSNILYLQSLGNYIKIYTPEKYYLTQVTTHEIEGKLPKEIFLRIHKSYIINKSKIQSITENNVVVGSTKLPIGKTFKKYVRESLGTM